MIKKEKELFEGNETIANNTFFMQIIRFFMQIKKLLIDFLFFSKIIVHTTPSVSVAFSKKKN